MIYQVYILFSPTRNKYYIGYTGDDLFERIRKHNTNHSGFTGKVGDWVIAHQEEYLSKADAIGREKQIKKWKSRIKIEKLIGLTGSVHPD